LNASPRLVPALQAESDGDRVVSFRFHSPGYNTQYRSREHTTATQHPSLEVLYLAVP
jgi:hypothetical protein